MSVSPGPRRLATCLAVGLVLLAVAARAADDPISEQGALAPRPVLQLPVDSAAQFEWVAAIQPATNAQPGTRGQPAANAQPAPSAPDQAMVAAGQAAFARSCTACHDEQRSLQKRKTYSGWLATVQRMASKEGADISSADYVPIATYLASVAGAGAGGAATAETGGTTEGGGGWSFATTVSTLHRSASDEYLLENPGFFADVWATASYQSSGAWRATATVCTSCHSRDNGAAGNAYSLELVEGSATLDLRYLFCCCRCDDGRELLLKGGRFIVPFGAYAGMSDPGAYRTVTHPLMFNMGRRVFVPGSPPQQPVLPAPFSDEGVDLLFRTPVGECLTFTMDLYAVNGLQGTGPNIFNRSRAYFDNNEEPSTGARMTLGGDMFRLGTSVLSGNLEDQQISPRVYYTLAGADATAQITDCLKFYFEYAIRHQNSVLAPGTKESTFGTVTQLELRLCDQPYIGVLVRYDTLEHRNVTFGEDFLSRVTTGLNIGLPGGSLLMINHERWAPKGAEEADVIGVRWTVSL